MMGHITPATLPRPRQAKHDRPRLAYSTSTPRPREVWGFFKKPTIIPEQIAATGMLQAGRQLIAITAKYEHELQGTIRKHACAGCEETIYNERITTSINQKPFDHYSDHHHWHTDCFEASQTSNQEHALGRWVIINWEER